MALLQVHDLGRMDYESALERQRAEHARVVQGTQGNRDEGSGTDGGAAVRSAAQPRQAGPWPLLLVEHMPPVITVSNRAGAAQHLLASPERLDELGVQVRRTDRGGDITWHGPGQLVAYPIVDLRALGLGIHAYIRALEEAVIRACATWGLACHREQGATGVWCAGGKICAIGVRVSRWVTMHGLALNVAPDLSHFGLIVPCGLHGRTVTSLHRELGGRAPSMAQAQRALVLALTRSLADAAPGATPP